MYFGRLGATLSDTEVHMNRIRGEITHKSE